MPRTTDPVSPESTVVGVDEDPKMVHGQEAGGCGVTGLEALEAGPVPTPLVADTWNVYVVPFVRPVTTTLVAGGEPVTTVGLWAAVPMNGVTVEVVIGLPPLAGADQETDADPLPATAVTFVGAAGAVVCTVWL
jgi:hypothetical protein